MNESAIKRPVDYGTQEHRLRFLKHLRDNSRYTSHQLAEASGYSVDAVKSWFSNSESRRREIPDRAMAVLLQRVGYTEAAYRQAVQQYQPPV